jgi:two-component system, cell cycle response regulator DivK
MARGASVGCRILRDPLAHAGYEVIEIDNAEQAFSAAVEHRPDLIRMDIQLPLLDGYEATKRIKDRDDVLVTRPKREPPAATMSQPFSPRALLDKIRKFAG